MLHFYEMEQVTVNKVAFSLKSRQNAFISLTSCMVLSHSLTGPIANVCVRTIKTSFVIMIDKIQIPLHFDWLKICCSKMARAYS